MGTNPNSTFAMFDTATTWMSLEYNDYGDPKLISMNGVMFEPVGEFKILTRAANAGGRKAEGDQYRDQTAELFSRVATLDAR